MRCFKSETFPPLFLQVFITEDRFVTGAGWLYSQANSHRLGPFDLAQVVPACIKGVIVLSLCINFLADIYMCMYMFSHLCYFMLYIP